MDLVDLRESDKLIHGCHYLFINSLLIFNNAALMRKGLLTTILSLQHTHPILLIFFYLEHLIANYREFL